MVFRSTYLLQFFSLWDTKMLEQGLRQDIFLVVSAYRTHCANLLDADGITAACHGLSAHDLDALEIIVANQPTTIMIFR